MHVIHVMHGVWDMRRRVAICRSHQLACIGGEADGVAPCSGDLLFNRLQAGGTARDQRHLVALPGKSPCRSSPQACIQVPAEVGWSWI